MAIAYYLAIWFQAAKGETATHAGINTIPMVIAMVLSSILSAKITQFIGYYIPSLIACPLLSAVGAGMLSTMTRYSDHSYWIGYQVLFGFGLGYGAQQTSLASHSVLPKKDVPLGLALGFLKQQLGGAVFLSVCQNTFATKLIDRLSGVAGLDAQKFVDTGATDIWAMVPSEEMDRVVEAYNFAITRVLLLAAIPSACTIAGVAMMEYKGIKGMKGAKSADDEAKSVDKTEKV
ncbi:phosphoribosylformylglycinamidine synthase [Ascochyta rabiei]|uniref:Phosphoribosylformylglycinamidine synthase n=2 Tax=Didymella rabiei TaxID=5454 RepID=A0A162WLD9_DIDRA|nr:phosphoribosylformylglycinamidine synthase [Ascochyta rabiei]